MLHLRKISDIHLEFDQYFMIDGPGYVRRKLTEIIPPLPTDKKTVLIVAGDLATARGAQRIKIFFEIMQPRFKHIIYVLGNHEHYGSYMSDTLDIIKDCLKSSDSLNMKKITIAGNEPVKVTIGQVTFLCGTLWTDYSLGASDQADLDLFAGQQYAREAAYRTNGQPENADNLKKFMTENFETRSSLQQLHLIISRSIADHSKILDDRGLGVSPEMLANDAFKPTIIKFDEWLKDNDNSKTVIVTHHLPSFDAVALQYTQDPTSRLLNHAFASNLNDFILRHQPAYCFFGHTHVKYTGTIGKTVLHCNPLGYPHEPTVSNNLYDSTAVYSL